MRILIYTFAIVSIILTKGNAQFFNNPFDAFAGSFPGMQQNSIYKRQPACEIRFKNVKPENPTCVLPIDDFRRKGSLTEGSKSHGGHQLPAWANLTLAQEGQKFARENLNKIAENHLFSLILVIVASEVSTLGRDILLMTRNSDTPEAVKKRYTATLAQILLWYHDPIVPEDQAKQSPFLKSLAKVKKLHMAVAAIAKGKLTRGEPVANDALYKDYKIDTGMWEALDRDMKAAGVKTDLPANTTEDLNSVPVNQFMMSMTLCGFVCLPVAYPKRSGMPNVKDDELVAYNHLWAVIGYALGIDDEFNLALQPDLQTARKYYQKVIHRFHLSYIAKGELDFHSKLLIEVLLKGFNSVVAIQSSHVTIYRLISQIFDIPAPNLRKLFTPAEEAVEKAVEMERNSGLNDLFLIKSVQSGVTVNGIDTIGREEFGPRYDDRKYRAENVYTYPVVE